MFTTMKRFTNKMTRARQNERTF